ncbi:MAG: hypothetical protein Q8L81_11730 [Bacteroidota bacterium]|nr:hypothetical protein [Bacteroidota bacterium]
MKYSKDKLLDIGIEKLKNFGFLNVTKENIFEDEVYRYHFKKFISLRLGQENETDVVIKELFANIEKKDK